MLQLDRRTALPTQLFALPDTDGVDALHVVVKATFTLDLDASIAREQKPIVMADVHGGRAPRTWLRLPGEVHPAKPHTDVLVDGEAVAPKGRAVRELDVSIAVGSLRRALRVIGDRAYTGYDAPFCSDPAPFVRMPLTPDRAFGGAVDPRNPVGVGIVPATLRDPRALRSAPLPNIEDPAQRIRRVGEVVAPAMVTPVAPSWSPRREFAGTYDAHWDRSRAPLLPEDFDPRFLQAAPTEMQVREGLRGGEAIALVHLSDAPRVESRVPELGVRVRARFRDEVCELPARIETLHLHPNEGVATLLLRATLRCGHRLLDVSVVEVTDGAAR